MKLEQMRVVQILRLIHNQNKMERKKWLFLIVILSITLILFFWIMNEREDESPFNKVSSYNSGSYTNLDDAYWIKVHSIVTAEINEDAEFELFHDSVSKTLIISVCPSCIVDSAAQAKILDAFKRDEIQIKQLKIIK